MTETVTMPLTMPDPCDCGAGSGSTGVAGHNVVVAPFETGGGINLTAIASLPSLSLDVSYFIDQPSTIIGTGSSCPSPAIGDKVGETTVSFSASGRASLSGVIKDISVHGGNVSMIRGGLPDKYEVDDVEVDYPTKGSYLSPAITPCYRDLPCNFEPSEFASAGIEAGFSKIVYAGDYVSESLGEGGSVCYVNPHAKPSAYVVFYPGMVTGYSWGFCGTLYKIRINGLQAQLDISLGSLVSDVNVYGECGQEKPTLDYCVGYVIHRKEDYRPSCPEVASAIDRAAEAYRLDVEAVLNSQEYRIAHTVSASASGSSISISIDIPEQDIDLT